MKRRVLLFNQYYLPGYKSGGPQQSIANLVEHLGDEFAFQIVTSNHEFGENTPYQDIIPGEWYNVEKARVCYLAPHQQNLGGIARIMRETPHDTFYLNSFFDYKFSILPLLARRLGLAPRRPAILAPRGEFSPGALALKSTKKKLFIAASKVIGLHNDLIWQASTEREADDIRNAVGQTAKSIHIACDLPKSTNSELKITSRELDHPLRVVFLSRISPKKNLLGALKMLSHVQSPVNFTIYGPKEDEAYWARCKSVISALPSHIQVEYKGQIHPDTVIDHLSQHDLFFLPTLGENYGHVIIEALLAGLPVLISDQTPWMDMEENGVGWSLPLKDGQAFAQTIEKVAQWDDKVLEKIKHKAHQYGIQHSEDGAKIEQNQALFNA
ncbi:MAG: glycosyl transferase family 1 [Robiginitomaculum sp.]|nr:MAG: glycosyl transferase family 1 [Robiginitomaculum sp.]